MNTPNSLNNNPGTTSMEEEIQTQQPIDLPAIESTQIPTLEALQPTEQKTISTIDTPPPIENNNDFNFALDQYAQLNDSSPFKETFGDLISNYREKEILLNYRDPITDKEKQTYQEKHKRLQALTKDWKQNPEAREVIAKSYGEAFAKSWEYATPEEKALTGGIKILDELYSKEGDEENSSMWRYIEHNKLKDNTHITSAKDIWQHYSDNIKPLIEAQNKEAQAEQSFAEKSQPFFNARLEGKTVLESLKTIPNLSPEEKFYAITQCGDGSEWNKSVLNAKEWVEQNGIKFAEQVSPMQTQDFAYKLLDLKKKNQKAYDKVIAIYKNEITKERNDGIAVISPFINSLSASVNSLNDFFRGRTSIGGAILFLPDERSPEQSQQISEVRNMLKELQESPEGASYWRSIFDGVAQIGATTAMLPIGGVQSIFIVGGGDSYDKNYGESGDKLSSILRGVVAGGTEALTERLGGEFLFKNMKFLAKKLPFMEKATGYFGGTVDMLRAANYKSAAARFGGVTVASGASDWAEELIQPTLQASLDAPIAWLFNEKNGMTYQDWKDQISAAMSPELVLQMTLFGAVAGGAQIPMFAREAKISRMNAPEVQTLTRCDEATAKNIANIINPTEKAQAIREASIDNILSQEEQSQNLLTGINNMQEDFTVLNAMTAYQAEVELGNIPKYEEQEDGSYLATDRTINEDGSSTESTRSLSPELAMAEINAHLEDKLAQRITTIQSNLTARATIDTMKSNNAFVFEKMSDTETKQTLNTLAAAAGLKIKEGAPTHSIDPALSQNLTLRELQQLPNAAAKREQIATTQGSSAPFASNAYRVRLSSGKTLIRYVEGKITMNQLLEEVVETHLYNYFAQTGKNISWAAGNIRAIQKQLKEQGTIKENLIKEDGEIEMMDILESMGILAQASFIHRIDSLKLPEFLKDFIKWCRSIISQASHLADLGKAIHSLDKAGKLDKTFAQAIYEAADITQEFWKDAAMDSTHLELARIASAAVAPYQTNLSSSQDISNGAYQAWLDTTTIEDTDQDNATPPYERTEENTQTPTLNASFSVTAHDEQGNTLHPETFITKKDGNIDWFILPKYGSLKNLPLRLLVGEDINHKGYGLTHIAARHHQDAARLNKSYEEYLNAILDNIGEIRSVVDGRSIIVRGKTPKMAMFINLVEKSGYYSIITAFPVRQGYIEQYKKIASWSELTKGRNGNNLDLTSDLNTSATFTGVDANQQSGDNLPNGLPTVNIKDVTCTFDDGSTLQASFSISPQEEQQWKKNLNNYLTKGAADRAMPIKMSSVPNVLQALGFSDRDIVITPSTLDKVMGGKHDLDRSHIERLAAAIHDPIMIVDSATQAGAIVVLTEIKTAEGNVIAAIHLDKQERGGFYHVVASAYNKKSPWMFVEQIKANKLRYIDKKRALAWARENRLQLPALSSQKGKAIVLTPEDVVKYKNAQNKKSIPLSDFLQGDQTDSTSFSVIGTHAKNWETIKHNAFTGRDDGMLRVELDASQSSITPDLAQRIQRRLAKDNSEKKVRFTLKNVLDYPALYQAYPKLANMSITLASLGARGTRAWYSPKTKKITINTLNFDSNTYDSAALRSTILHEIQHAIQHIEGYTYGSSSSDEAKYLRAGGEIEARNVQQRRDLTAQQRQEQPFNNSLEYKGEALPSISPAPIEIPFNLVSGEFDKDWTSLRRSSNKAHSNFIALITQALNKDAERLTRYSELSEDERADMAITLMRATNIAKTAVMYMPKGYRIGLKPYLDWMEVFADIAHNGELDWAATAPAHYWSQRMQAHLAKVYGGFVVATEDTDQALALLKNYGETRLYMLLNKLILRISGNLEEYGKTKLHDQITELLHSTKPKLNKNGQYSTGTLSVESRRELARLTQLMQLEPANLDNKLDELNGKILALQENAEDQAQEQIDNYEAQKLELEVYGSIATKSIDELDRLYTALTRHIRGEKATWAASIDARKQKHKDIAEAIIKGIENRHGDIDSNAITRAKEDKKLNGKKKSLTRRIWNAMSSIESLPQLLAIMERDPESKAYASDLRHRVSTAGANLNIAHKHLNARFRQYILDAYKLPSNTSNFKLDRILADLKKTQKTGIHLPVYTHRKLSLPIHIAALLANKQQAKLAALKEELTAQKQQLETQYLHEQTSSTGSLETDKALKSTQEQLDAINAEYTQQDLDEMQQWLAEETTSHNTKTKLWQEGLARKPIEKTKLEHNYLELEKIEDNELELSKDAALYIILLHEQSQYTQLVEEAFQPQHIETLKNYVGTEALTLAYKMRKHLAQQGERIAQTYEATTGIPFPRIPNYFAARFRMENKLIDFTIEDMLTGMQDNAMGTGNKFLTARKNHNQNLDLSIGATNTFVDAVNTSEHWLQTQSITTDLRGVLTRKNVINALRINYGRHSIDQLKQWLQCLQNTGKIDGNIKTNTSLLHSQLYSSGAIAILTYKIESVIRQLSGIANIWAGDNSLSTLDWLKAMAHLKNNPMSLNQMLHSPYIKSRTITTTDLTTIKAARKTNDQPYNVSDRLADIGMIPMSVFDANPQAIPATLLYNANYRKAQESTLPDGNKRTEKECEAIAWSAVHAAFATASQPMHTWEKSHASHELGAGLGRAAFFMMSENINKLGLIYSLTKQRKYTKATAVWLVYGALNASIGALLDAMRDDPEEWDERKLSGYLYASLFGMFSGIPILSEGLEYILHQAGADIYLGSSGRGIIDATAFSRSIKNIITKSDDYSYEDWIKESMALSRTLGIVGGAMGNTFGSALLLSAGLSNPVKTSIKAKDSALLNAKEEYKYEY